MTRGKGRMKIKRKSYYVKKRVLSVRNAILLHLLEHYRAQWPGNMPFAVSQEGVADGVQGHRGHVSRILRELIAEGLVYQDVGRVDEVMTRVKAYHVTEDGAREAVWIADEVGGTSVDVSGRAEPVTLADLERQYVGRSGLLELALHTEKRSFDAQKFEAWLSSREVFVNRTKRMPVLRQFFGRREELDALEEWFGSEATTLAMSGMAGMGKTALAAKFVGEKHGSANTFWFTVEEWSSLSYLLKELADFNSAMGVHGLNAYARSGSDPRLEESLLLLERELEGRKAVLVFDDVHKAGKRILEFLKGFGGILADCGGPKMILVGRQIPKLYDRRDVKVKHQVTELELDGLDEAGCTEFLLSKGISEASVKEIHEVTRGHPFFLELFEEGADLAKGSFSRFLREEVYEDLSQGEAAVLGAASIYRTPIFSAGLLLDDRASFSDVVTLSRRGLVTETTRGQYEMHDLLREFLSKTIGPAERARHHRGAGEYYRVIDDGETALEAVYHLIEAGEGEMAVELAVARGREVLARGVSAELLRILGQLIEDGAEGEDLAELLLLHGEASFRSGEWDGALESYDRALQIAEDVRNEYKTAEALRRMGELRLEKSDHEVATELLMASLQVSRRVKDLLGLADTYYELGKLYMRIGPYSKAKRHLDLSLKWAERSRDPITTGKALFILGALEGERGTDPERAFGLKQQALELFEQSGDVYQMARAHSGLGLSLEDLGQKDEAVDHYRRSLVLLKKCGSVRGQACVLQILAGLHISREEDAEAEPLLEEALDTFSQLKDRRQVAMIHMHYAGLHAAPGGSQLAMKHMDRAVKDFESLGEWVDFVRCLVYNGQLLSYMGKPSEAEAAFEKALTASDRIEDPKVRARILRQARAVSEGKEEVDVISIARA